jgi:hypothetical protein
MLSTRTLVGLRIDPGFMSWLPRLFAAILICFLSSQAGAQSWKDPLKAEMAKNTARMDAIEAKGKPIAAELNANTAAIAAHNAVHPDGVCTYPEGHPEACTPWLKEAEQLNTVRENLVSRLRPLVDESDRLEARNKELERRLRCVQPPTACTSDSDCNECGYCSTFDGRGKGGRCSPRP